jgi:hypothetical protein
MEFSHNMIDYICEVSYNYVVLSHQDIDIELF